jgi:hypothetical protein
VGAALAQWLHDHPKQRALAGPDDDALLSDLAGSRLCSNRWLPF